MDNRLKELRLLHNLSRAKLVIELKENVNLKVSERSIVYWENNERDIKKDVADSMAKYFDVDTEFLLGLTTIPNKEEYFKHISKIPGPTFWGKGDNKEVKKAIEEYADSLKKTKEEFTIDYSKAQSETNEITNETPEDRYLTSLENRLANIEILYDRVASGQEVPKEEILPYISYVAKSVKNEIDLFTSTHFGDINSDSN